MTEYKPINAGNRTPRDSMLLMGTIKAAGDFARQVQPIRIHNLSATGLMAASQAEYEAGCVVEVELRGIGIVAGEVVWVRNGRMGITFSQEIDPKRARQPVVAKSTDHLRKIAVRKLRRPGLKASLD